MGQSRHNDPLVASKERQWLTEAAMVYAKEGVAWLPAGAMALRRLWKNLEHAFRLMAWRRR